ncbi:hypothetical protein DERP_005505, partial [Dermatophagoides pteronyssinus]
VNSSQALLRNRIKLQQQNLARSYLYHSSSLDLEPSTTSIIDHQQHRSTPTTTTTINDIITTQSSLTTTTNNITKKSKTLPRGGEEVLINGGGHYHHHHGRSRSYQKPSATRNHHYGKHLFTSSSIDVAVTSESGIKTENQSINRTAAIDLNSNKMMPFILIVVSLTRYQSHYCLGYIINNNLILTLSSCLKSL